MWWTATSFSPVEAGTDVATEATEDDVLDAATAEEAATAELDALIDTEAEEACAGRTAAADDDNDDDDDDDDDNDDAGPAERDADEGVGANTGAFARLDEAAAQALDLTTRRASRRAASVPSSLAAAAVAASRSAQGTGWTARPACGRPERMPWALLAATEVEAARRPARSESLTSIAGEEVGEERRIGGNRAGGRRMGEVAPGC